MPKRNRSDSDGSVGGSERISVPKRRKGKTYGSDVSTDDESDDERIPKKRRGGKERASSSDDSSDDDSSGTEELEDLEKKYKAAKARQDRKQQRRKEKEEQRRKEGIEERKLVDMQEKVRHLVQTLQSKKYIDAKKITDDYRDEKSIVQKYCKEMLQENKSLESFSVTASNGYFKTKREKKVFMPGMEKFFKLQENSDKASLWKEWGGKIDHESFRGDLHPN